MNNKDIIDNTPDGATYLYGEKYLKSDNNKWFMWADPTYTNSPDWWEHKILPTDNPAPIRLLSDIEQIAELQVSLTLAVGFNGDIGAYDTIVEKWGKVDTAKYEAVCAELEEAHKNEKIILATLDMSADMLRVAEAERPKWTLCSDELPPVNKDVLVGCYDVDGYEVDYIECDPDYGVDYWANEVPGFEYDFWFMPPAMPYKPPEADK